MARVSKKELKDGKILNELIQRFIHNTTFENLYPLLLCLIDSDLQVPVNAIVSDEDVEVMKKSKKGDTLTLVNDLRLRPDWLKNQSNNQLYFPIFSTIEEATKEYSQNFSWINMNIDTCINFVENNKESVGIVLNAFTTPIFIEGKLFDLLKDILKEERKKEKVKINENK